MMNCEKDFDSLIISLDKNDMTNKQHYKNVIYLSQRIQYQINQLKNLTVMKKKNKEFRRSSSNSLDQETSSNKEEDDDLLLQSSPTETMIAYYDEYNRDKSLPSQHSSVTTIQQMHNDDGNNKPLPIVPKSNNNSLYITNGGYDSAVDLASSTQDDLVFMSIDQTENQYPTNKPLPSIHYNKIRNLTIIHVKKKYNGLKGLLTRAYQLSDIEVSRTLLSRSSPYYVKLFASRDKSTGERKAVLKVTLTTSNTSSNLFIIPYYEFTFYYVNTLMTKAQKLLDLAHLSLVTDLQIQSALFIWLNYYHHQLPSIQQVTHVLREGLKIYIVYNHNNPQ